MGKFDKLIEEGLLRYIKEDDSAPVDNSIGGQSGMNTPPPPTNTGDAQPTPQAGAGMESNYDKPYKDLAKVLYDALRVDYNELDSTLKNKILALDPEDIKNDKQAVSIFKTIERVIQEYSGIPGESENFAPGAQV